MRIGGDWWGGREGRERGGRLRRTFVVIPYTIKDMSCYALQVSWSPETVNRQWLSSV